jgi:predicted  nucleic acid-binding Zn-ribbon protein
MQKSEKPLPPLPQLQAVSLEDQQCSYLRQQNMQLEQQNETLRYALRKASERITQLQRQMIEHQRYITQQHEDFVRVTRKVYSAYQEYYSAVESGKNKGVDMVNEAAQACAAFSDSEEDLI